MLHAFLILLSAAASPAPGYQAVPETQPREARLIVRDQLWYCGGGSCRAAEGNSRPEIVCQSVAGELGRLRSFAVAGAPLAADKLEKCNARAR
jgi:hypothetical protein